MKKLTHLLLSIITAVLAVFVTPLPQADPPELDCTGDVPCAAPQLVALPPDSPDGGTDVGPPPTTQIVATGDATTGVLPPFVEDYSPPLRRRLPRPMPQADEGWLGATAPSLRPLG